MRYRHAAEPEWELRVVLPPSDAFCLRCLVAACAAFGLSTACGEEPEPITPPSFERPERVALVCFNVEDDGDGEPVALEDCASDDEKHKLHALITQTSRGEVAAVDLDKSEVIDTRKEIPGYTFVPVGEVPTAIVVPERKAENAKTTYVANFGSRDVSVIPTRAFRSSGAEAAKLASQKIDVPVGGRPVDMVISPDEDEKSLFLALPREHAIVRLTLCRGADTDPGSASNAGAALDAGADSGAGVDVDAGPQEPCAWGEIAKKETLRLPDYSYDQLRRIAAAVPQQSAAEQVAYQYSCGFDLPPAVEQVPSREFAGLFGCESGGTEPEPDADEDAGVDLDAGLRPEVGPGAGAGGSTAGPNAAAGAGQAGSAAQGGAGQGGGIGSRPDAGAGPVGGFSADAGVPPGGPPGCTALSPRPTALFVDEHGEGGPRLLVADSVLPVVHVVDVNSFAEVAAGEGQLPDPIVVGVPTSEVVATPEVPATIPPTLAAADELKSEVEEGAGADVGQGFKRYIYAIDATDGSVLAVDAKTHAVQVVNADPRQPADRIPLGSLVASSLAVMTPGFEDGDTFVSQCRCSRAEEWEGVAVAPDPANLQGVFLAVASTTGGIRVVDVHDMRAVDMRECRHSECLDAEGNPAMVPDAGVPALDTESHSAEWCSSEEECPDPDSENALYPYLEECRTCCHKDEKEGAGIFTFDTPKVCVQSRDSAGELIDFDPGTCETLELCVQCRDSDGAPIPFDPNRCRRCLDENGEELSVAVRRHLPRIGAVYESAAPQPQRAPFFTIDGRTRELTDQGEAQGDEAYGLDHINCDGIERIQGFEDIRMQRSFPRPGSEVLPGPDASVDDDDAGVDEDPSDAGVSADGTALVCARSDPWAARAEAWYVTFEGVIPKTSGGDGKFVEAEGVDGGVPGEDGGMPEGTVRFEAEGMAFCRRGVLGSLDQEGGRAGDLLVIVSEPQSEEDIERADFDKLAKELKVKPSHCDILTEELLDGAPPRVAFRIREAFQDHLILEEGFIVEEPEQDEEREGLQKLLGKPERARTFEFIRYCMAGMVMGFEVRTSEAYTVVGSQTQFLHSVEAGEGGRCRDSQFPLRVGRAYEGELFVNPAIAFQITVPKRRTENDADLGSEDNADLETIPFGERPRNWVLEIVMGGIAKTGVSLSGLDTPWEELPNLPADLLYDSITERLFVVDVASRGLVRISLNPFPTSLQGSRYIN